MTDDEVLQQTICLVPARKGSVRVPGKNTRPLGGIPLVEWTIRQAEKCGFRCTYVTSDDEAIREIVRPPAKFIGRFEASTTQPDIEWLQEIRIWIEPKIFQWFCILRPTSPFRQPSSIREAVCKLARSDADSLRGIRKVKEHPWKMWRKVDDEIVAWDAAFMEVGQEYDLPYQSLPEVYVQDSSIHVARTSLLPETMTGSRVLGYEFPGHEGFSIDTEDDWWMAELLMARQMGRETSTYVYDVLTRED